MTSRPRAIRLSFAALAALAASLVLCGAPAAATSVDEAKSFAPHLLLIHGGGFLFDDPTFEAATRGAAEDAGFIPHYLRYPLADLPGAVRAARIEARRIGNRYSGHVYSYGSSAGGMVAALLAGDGMVRAAVAKAPPSDLVEWRWPLELYGDDYFERIGATPMVRRSLSPLRRPVRRPLLLVHGRHDRVVPLAMSEAFANKFRRVHLWALNGGHHVERARPWVLERSLTWLARLDEDPRPSRPTES